MADDRGAEARILEGCRAGDPAAARELVARYQATLFRVAGRLAGRWDVAEEIVQESFLKAFAHIEQIDPRRGALGWLLRIVINVSRTWQHHSSRREESRPLSAAAEPIFAGRLVEPEAAAIAAEQRVRLAAALDQLPPALREIVVLRYIEGLPFDVIARATGTPGAALRMRAVRARTKLRALLQDDAP